MSLILWFNSLYSTSIRTAWKRSLFSGFWVHTLLIISPVPLTLQQKSKKHTSDCTFSDDLQEKSKTICSRSCRCPTTAASSKAGWCFGFPHGIPAARQQKGVSFRGSSTTRIKSLASHCLPCKTAFLPQLLLSQQVINMLKHPTLDIINLTYCPLANTSGPSYCRQTSLL